MNKKGVRNSSNPPILALPALIKDVMTTKVDTITSGFLIAVASLFVLMLVSLKVDMGVNGVISPSVAGAYIQAGAASVEGAYTLDEDYKIVTGATSNSILFIIFVVFASYFVILSLNVHEKEVMVKRKLVVRKKAKVLKQKRPKARLKPSYAR